MKQCPTCQSQYADETLSFCLQDGTPLVDVVPSDTPTVVLGETETFVARGPQPGSSHAWQPSEVTRVQSFEQPVPQKSSSKTVLAVILTALGMLVVFGMIGVAALLYMNSGGKTTVSNANTNVVLPTVNLNSNSSLNANLPAGTPVRPSPTPESSPRPSPKPTVDEPPPRDLARYPSTTRLRFARGAYTTSFSGDLNPGDQRSLVLACRAGQSLSASISGGASCVSIRGGGSSYRTTTRGGDNYVTVTNRCSEGTRFSISITVI